MILSFSSTSPGGKCQGYHFYSTYRRAQAYYHLGDYPKALADCEEALQLDPGNEFLKRLKKMTLARLKM